MSLRTSHKVPRYGSFYLKSDRIICVIPFYQIAKAISGDNVISSRSQVMLKIGSLELEAEIIGVNDDPSKLLRLEVEFLLDPANAHLFDEPEPEPTKGKRKLPTKENAAKKCSKDGATQAKRRKKEPELPAFISPEPTPVLPQLATPVKPEPPTPVQPVQPPTPAQPVQPPTPVPPQPCTPVPQPPTPRMSPMIDRSKLASLLSPSRRNVPNSPEISQYLDRILHRQKLMIKRLVNLMALCRSPQRPVRASKSSFKSCDFL